MRIFAPFTHDEVVALNEWQRLGYVHEFTCPKHGTALVAHGTGWECPDSDCDYRQTWAHDFMADTTKHPPHPFHQATIEETPTREHLLRRVAFYARECERQGEIIERLQANEEAIRALIEQWRVAAKGAHPSADAWLSRCAAELEAVIGWSPGIQEEPPQQFPDEDVMNGPYIERKKKK